MGRNFWFGNKSSKNEVQTPQPRVGQAQAQSQIMKEQFELLPVERRADARIAVYGIASGNGLDQLVPCGAGQVMGIDTKQNFIDECRQRWQELEEHLSLHWLEDVGDPTKTAEAIADCDLIIANLWMGHMYIETFARIVKMLPKHGQIISCVLKADTDRSLTTAAKKDVFFKAIADYSKESNKSAVDQAMKAGGFRLLERKVYELTDWKQFIRCDYAMK